MPRSRRVLGRAGVAMLTLLAATGLASAQTFNLVGVAPGDAASRLYGLSADGRVAAGFSLNTTSAPNPGYMWTRDVGRQDWGLAAGLPTTTASYGISGDGQTSVGECWSATQASRAFRYRGPGTFEMLAPLDGGERSAAYGASNDGSIVVGRSSAGSFDAVSQATIWAGGGPIGLGWTQADGVKSEARAISRDGATVVGSSADSAGFAQAFAWTATGGIHALPHPSGLSAPSSGANAVSGDGRFIVGGSNGQGQPTLATIWRDGIATRLPPVNGSPGWTAFGVSDSGDILVGTAANVLPNIAVVWTPSTGTMRLDSYLAGFGVTVPAGWMLTECRALSMDGTVFGGFARETATGFTQGFVATIPAPGLGSMAVVMSPVLGLRRRRTNLS